MYVRCHKHLRTCAFETVAYQKKKNSICLFSKGIALLTFLWEALPLGFLPYQLQLLQPMGYQGLEFCHLPEKTG